jgi:hypothetical protein
MIKNFLSRFFKSKRQIAIEGLQKIHAIFDDLEREALTSGDKFRYDCTLAVKRGVMSGLGGILINAHALSKNWADNFTKEDFKRKIDSHCQSEKIKQYFTGGMKDKNLLAGIVE